VALINPETSTEEEIIWAWLNALVSVLEINRPNLARLLAVYLSHYVDPKDALSDGNVVRVGLAMNLPFSRFCTSVRVRVETQPP
jgi:hypothetical protein